jgi:hypothetical protein
LLKRDFREDIYPLTSHVEEKKKTKKKRGANAESIKTHDLIGQDGKDKGIKNEKMKKKKTPDMES